MKKKKKKNILLFSLHPDNPTFRLQLPKVISAPDVPNNFSSCGGGDLQSCSQFCDDLFGNCVNEDEVELRVFVRQLAEKMIVSWNTIQVKDQLYIKIPLNASKESFIALLDYAEENLQVCQVVACIERQQQNCNSTVKAFQFMGFELIQSGTHEVSTNINRVNQPTKSRFLCLGYDLE